MVLSEETNNILVGILFGEKWQIQHWWLWFGFKAHTKAALHDKQGGVGTKTTYYTHCMTKISLHVFSNYLGNQPTLSNWAFDKVNKPMAYDTNILLWLNPASPQIHKLDATFVQELEQVLWTLLTFSTALQLSPEQFWVHFWMVLPDRRSKTWVIICKELKIRKELGWDSVHDNQKKKSFIFFLWSICTTT